MLEAATLLDQGAPAVIVVLAEERPPAAYDEWIDDVPFSYAVALRVDKSGPDRGEPPNPHWQLRLQRNTDQGHSSAWPHALAFLRALHGPREPLQHAWKMRRWIWQPTN
jgi:hypothetical protein